MHYVPIDKLEPNMITAERVVSRRGQVIVDKDIVLTVQMISHMHFYGISQVKILDNEYSPEALNAAFRQQEALETYSDRIRKSPEFKVFKASYEKKVGFIENSLNDVITKNMPIDKASLLSQTMELFSKNATTISMFDMLHNMRKINDSTYAHSVNVSIIARMIGIWSNYPEDVLDTITLGGLVHDIGKCKIPKTILDKPGRLTGEEYAVIKQHPSIGYEIVKNQNIDKRSRLCILEHHERCDGSGYPLGLEGNDIDDYANIIAIADVYDAMTSARCYRNGLCPFEVIANFEKEGLNKYKPQFITTFLERIANTYINNEVLLSDGTTGSIILINKQLTRPVIRTESGQFINLVERPDLYVQAII